MRVDTVFPVLLCRKYKSLTLNDFSARLPCEFRFILSLVLDSRRGRFRCLHIRKWSLSCSSKHFANGKDCARASFLACALQFQRAHPLFSHKVFAYNVWVFSTMRGHFQVHKRAEMPGSRGKCRLVLLELSLSPRRHAVHKNANAHHNDKKRHVNRQQQTRKQGRQNTKEELPRKSREVLRLEQGRRHRITPDTQQLR